MVRIKSPFNFSNLPFESSSEEDSPDISINDDFKNKSRKSQYMRKKKILKSIFDEKKLHSTMNTSSKNGMNLKFDENSKHPPRSIETGLLNNLEISSPKKNSTTGKSNKSYTPYRKIREKIIEEKNSFKLPPLFDKNHRLSYKINLLSKLGKSSVTPHACIGKRENGKKRSFSQWFAK